MTKAEDMQRLARLANSSPIYRDTPFPVRIFRSPPRTTGAHAIHSDKTIMEYKMSKTFFLYRSVASTVNSALDVLLKRVGKKALRPSTQQLKAIVQNDYALSLTLGNDLLGQTERYEKILRHQLNVWKQKNAAAPSFKKELGRREDRITQFTRESELFKALFDKNKKIALERGAELGIEFLENGDPTQTDSLEKIFKQWKDEDRSLKKNPVIMLHNKLVDENTVRIDTLRKETEKAIIALAKPPFQDKVQGFLSGIEHGKSLDDYKSHLAGIKIEIEGHFQKVLDIKYKFRKLLKLTRLCQRNAREKIKEARELYIAADTEESRKVYKEIYRIYDYFSYRLNKHEFNIQNEGRVIGYLVRAVDKQEIAVKDVKGEIYSDKSKALKAKILKPMSRPKRIKDTLGQDLDSKITALFKRRRVKLLVAALVVAGIAATLWTLFDGYPQEPGIRS
jgi:hypothetical protein